MTIFVGKTIEEAKEKANTQLKLGADRQVTINVIQQPRHGFLGIGRREAKIEVTIKRSAHKKVEKRQEELKKSEKVIKKPKLRPKMIKNNDELAPVELERRHQSNLKKVHKAGEELTVYLTTVFKKLGIDVEPEINDVESHELIVDIKTKEPGRVIGKHGRRINAMEQLSNAFMDYHGAPKVSVILDTSNYRERRKETVHHLAERAVTEVVASGKAVFMNPMPARERKQIHQELEGNSHVKTYSHGREPYRSIVIAPKN